MAGPEEPPLLIVEDERERLAAAKRLEAEGWKVRSGWSSPGGRAAPEHMVCVGVVTGADDAAAALLAATRGAGLVVEARCHPEVLERLFEDLRHIGSVRYLRRGEPELGPPEPGLDRDQLGLLELISRGSSLVEAAAAMHLSRRTAQRRLAGARRTLGVQSTAEAIRKALGSD